jgi:ComF family protein
MKSGGLIPGRGRIVLGDLGRRLLDAVLPPRCLGCVQPVERPGLLCGDCWREMHFLAPPYCACCGYPFEYEEEAEALCAGCLGAPPPFVRARAVLRYDDHSRGLILRFKHADRIEGARAFAAWMQRAGGELLAESDVIVPVPLHWLRLFQRRYNQAALLAQALGRATELPVVPDLLLRRRNTPSQGHLSADQRARNVAGAFAVHRRQRQRLAGARVLLIDDVMTTGATAAACTRTLRRAGAKQVRVLTLARVVRPLR